MKRSSKILSLTSAIVLAGTGLIAFVLPERGEAEANDAAAAKPAAAPAPALASAQIVAMRRLTEAQYRNSIADIFGPDIRVSGRFEPIVRPIHELISSGASGAAISPAGLEQFDAIGRVIAAQVFGEARRADFTPCQPQDAAKADAACARAALAPLGRYLFRRPLTTSEEAFYVRIASDAAAPTGSFYKGLELALAAMLVSPKFLYVIETGQADPAHPGAIVLDSQSRASRLSFMLWNSAPNENLLRAAESGKLMNDAALASTAQAMVASPRFEQGVRAFFADMLLFEKFDELAKDPLIFPYFNQDVAQALPEQLLRTITGHLLTRNGDYRELFTTRQTYMTRALGALYHVPVTKSRGWEPYEFAEGQDRSGLLGQAGFLALYSHSGRSSPTLRGRAIREVLMCQEVPNPPGNVNFTAVQDTANKAMPTARIRLTAHNTDPACTGCHLITDPPGLALERFDGIGAYRQSENDAEIDPSGAMDGTQFVGASGLGKAVASSQDTSLCLANRALEYALGRPPRDDDAVMALEQQFAATGYSIRALFLKVASAPDTYRLKSAPLEGASTHAALRRR